MNVMVNNGLVEVVKVLDNGVEVIKNNLVNDFREAQNILDITDATENFDAQSLYVEREYSFFENTYSVKVERKEDFKQFRELLKNENCYNAKIEGIRELYNSDIYNFTEYFSEARKVEMCTCAKCNFVGIVSFEAWKSGLIEVEEFNDYLKENKKRTYKLGKYMKKLNFSQSVIDFYATQVKIEKPIYLTISSKVQFITGMSNYAKPRSWNGYRGTSCQDTRHHGYECKHLSGAIGDDKLYIAFLHDELADLNDMTDKMLARTLMRPIEIESEIALIPILYYGNNDTRDMLHYALKQLRELLIYSNDVTDYNHSDSFGWYSDNISGGAEIEDTIEQYVSFSEYIMMSCPCPQCDGDGEINVTAHNRNGEEFNSEVECPMCEGSGEYEEETLVTHSSYVDVTVTEIMYTYSDNSSYYDFDECKESYSFRVNETMIQEDIMNIE